MRIIKQIWGISILITVVFSQLPAQNMRIIPWKTDCDLTLLPQLNNKYLSLKGGLEIIHEKQTRFGGFSALWADSAGKRLITVSDFTSVRKAFPDSLRALWYEFKPVFDAEGNLTNLQQNKSGQMQKPDGRAIPEIESCAVHKDMMYITRDNGNGEAHRILRIPLNRFNNAGPVQTDTEEIPVKTFPEKAKQGFEAAATTADGRLLLIREESTEKQFAKTWLIKPGDSSAREKYFRLTQGAAKGMTKLGNNNFLIIEKSFKKGHTKMAITLLPKHELQNDTLKTKVLLSAESNCLDNFEGIAAFVRDNKEYFFLITDNNGDWQKAGKQKNLLLLFEIRR